MTHSRIPTLTAPNGGGFSSSATSPSTATATASTAPVAASESNQQVLTIALASVLSAAGLLLLVAGFLLFRRYKQRRPPFFRRGITPIDDEEIESWKISREIRDEEKMDLAAYGAGIPGSGPSAGRSTRGTHVRGASSTNSLKKMPSAVIVYQNPPAQAQQPLSPGMMSRPSEEFSPRSFISSPGISRYNCAGRPSLDREVPPTPVQARAPNAREGLTDQSIPGDEPFLPQPRGQPSRISKLPAPTSPRSTHTRFRSSRSSMRSLLDRDRVGPYYGSNVVALEQELSPRYARASSDLPRGTASRHPSNHHYHHHQRLRHSKSSAGHHALGHARVYSNSDTPPRLSLSDDFLTSPRPLLRDEIGRAIG